jgi:ribonuclease HI
LTAELDWDWVLVGDGSGSGWDAPCGWACLAADRLEAGDAYLFEGGCRAGSVNFAEAMAYVHALAWILNHEKGRAGAMGVVVRRVHVFTDSRYCQSAGAARDPLVGSHPILWHALESVARLGLLLDWHWLGRNSGPLNVRADALSKLFRRHVADYNREEAPHHPVCEGEVP